METKRVAVKVLPGVTRCKAGLDQYGRMIPNDGKVEFTALIDISMTDTIY